MSPLSSASLLPFGQLTAENLRSLAGVQVFTRIIAEVPENIKRFGLVTTMIHVVSSHNDACGEVGHFLYTAEESSPDSAERQPLYRMIAKRFSVDLPRWPVFSEEQSAEEYKFLTSIGILRDIKFSDRPDYSGGYSQLKWAGVVPMVAMRVFKPTEGNMPMSCQEIEPGHFEILLHLARFQAFLTRLEPQKENQPKDHQAFSRHFILTLQKRFAAMMRDLKKPIQDVGPFISQL